MAGRLSSFLKEDYMQKRRIYLAGPITGLSYGEARHGWREEFANLMSGRHPDIECFSPMRAKNFLSKSQNIASTSDSYGKDSPFGQGSGILARDHNDVFTCDAMIANFLDAKVGSLGTAAEFGFAHAYKKPIVMIIEPHLLDEKGVPVPGQNPHHHVFLRQMAGYIVNDLETAVDVVASLLTPGI
jgi:nucleoside 2-deoxyribosyltransferase